MNVFTDPLKPSKKRQLSPLRKKAKRSLLSCDEPTDCEGKDVDKDEEEKRLESVLFGVDDILEGDLAESDADSETENEDSRKKEKKSDPPASVWKDDDDDLDEQKEEKTVNRRTLIDLAWRKSRGVSTKDGQPAWSKIEDEEEDATGSKLLRRVGAFLKPRKVLPSKFLPLSRMADLNRCTKAEGPIVSAVEFHPWSQVALVAGKSGTLSLVAVDGKENSKLHSVCFNGFPVRSAHFTSNGEEILAGSDVGAHMFSYDVQKDSVQKIVWNRNQAYSTTKRFIVSPDGKYYLIFGTQGYLHLMAARSKEWVASVKVNGDVTAAAFSADGEEVYASGADGTGEVLVWDVGQRRCVHKFVDDGSTCVTSISASPCGGLLAVGSESGVVNLYDTSGDLLTSQTPVPSKAVMNLVTEVDSLKFNGSSELLFMSSGVKDNAIRILHVPSKSVYANFPGPQTNFKRVVDFDVSPNTGYFAIGNNVGRAPLFRLTHFDSY